MKYFNNSMSQDEAKKLFRKLAIKLHPDKGGNHVEFIKMQNEYENFLKGNFNYTSQQAKENSTSLYEFIKTNDFIKNFKDVTVELTGTWIWLSGNTIPYKDTIKANGFKWSKSKKKWYKAPHPLKRKRKTGRSFAYIKDKYGYQAHKLKGATAIE